MQNALFACRNGKIRVGRKGYARQFAVGGIVLDARRAFFFVATRDKPHATVQPHVLFRKPSKRVQRGDERTFVVADAPSVHNALTYIQLKRRGSPAVACGNDVEMGENAGDKLALAVFRPARIAAVGARFKPERARKAQKSVQRAPVFRTERSVGSGRRGDGRHGYERREIVGHLFKCIVHAFIIFYARDHVNFIH